MIKCAVYLGDRWRQKAGRVCRAEFRSNRLRHEHVYSYYRGSHNYISGFVRVDHKTAVVILAIPTICDESNVDN